MLERDPRGHDVRVQQHLELLYGGAAGPQLPGNPAPTLSQQQHPTQQQEVRSAFYIN